MWLTKCCVHVVHTQLTGIVYLFARMMAVINLTTMVRSMFVGHADVAVLGLVFHGCGYMAISLISMGCSWLGTWQVRGMVMVGTWQGHTVRSATKPMGPQSSRAV